MTRTTALQSAWRGDAARRKLALRAAAAIIAQVAENCNDSDITPPCTVARLS